MKPFSPIPDRLPRPGIVLFLMLAVGLTVSVWVANSSAQPQAGKNAPTMSKAEEPDELGLTLVGKTYFPVPSTTQAVKVPNANFEEGRQAGRPWSLVGMKITPDDNAPAGKQSITSTAGKRFRLVLSDIPITGNQTYLMSLFVKSTGPTNAVFTGVDADTYFGKNSWMGIPDTKGQWKRVGLYFRTPPGAKIGQMQIRPASNDEKLVFAADDFRLRTATEKEFSKGFDAWRSKYAKRDLKPRPDDGKNLPVFLSKLTQPKDPKRPLLVYGIGSSYTNMLGNGEVLIQHIRKHFPNAPPIVYKKHVGSAVPYEYTRGWMQQMVVGQKPDLVILYSTGSAEALDQLLTDFRQQSTADIIVPTLHLRQYDKKITPKTIDTPLYDALREVAKKHQVEFVESRREWAKFLLDGKHDLNFLLKDAVHQNDHGALIINENITRHLAPPSDLEKVSRRAQERERRLLVTAPKKSIRQGESIQWTDDWKTQGSVLQSSTKDAKLTITFVGNRLDAIGKLADPGGTAHIIIDGKPADQAPAFVTTLILPGKKNNRPARGLVSDRAPHAIQLGQNIVPQDWTIRMTDDNGSYELVGSVTGPDGKGHNLKPFTSTSGQIIVPPELWRNNVQRRRVPKDPKNPKAGMKIVESVPNKTGDIFTFKVLRSATPTLSTKGEADQLFRKTLVNNLPIGKHTVEIIAGGDGPLPFLGFDVFEPPLKRTD